MSPLLAKGCLIFLLPLLLPASIAATPDQARAAGVVESMEAKLLEEQEKVQRLGRGIEDQKGRIADSRQKEAELLGRLERLENQLETDRRRLLELREQTGKQEGRLAEIELERELLLSEQQELGRQVQGRLAAFYRMGEVGILNVLFSASSLPELLDLEEYFTRLLQHDRRMIIDFRRKIAEVNEAGRKLAGEKMHLAALQAEIEAQEERAAATRREQLDFLKTVRTEKQLNQRAVRELETAARQLAATLEKLREETPASPPEGPDLNNGNNQADQGFAARKGRLPSPVPGVVISGFGEDIPGKFGIVARATGIVIKAEPGTGIRAIHAGRVLYAGYLRGYGNLLIIDHGRQYYTLLSRAERFLTEKDAEVQPGQVIGITAGHSQPPDEGLHFEIRHGSEPQDPLAWLDGAELFLSIGGTEKIQPDFSSFKP